MELSTYPLVGPSLKATVQPVHWTAFHSYLRSAAGVHLLLKAKPEGFATEAKHLY